MDFVKSGCEKSLAEVQTDSFSFECRGCTRMKELELELEQLRLLVVAVVVSSAHRGPRSEAVAQKKLCSICTNCRDERITIEYTLNAQDYVSAGCEL